MKEQKFFVSLVRQNAKELGIEEVEKQISRERKAISVMIKSVIEKHLNSKEFHALLSKTVRDDLVSTVRDEGYQFYLIGKEEKAINAKIGKAILSAFK